MKMLPQMEANAENFGTMAIAFSLESLGSMVYILLYCIVCMLTLGVCYVVVVVVVGSFLFQNRFEMLSEFLGSMEKSQRLCLLR